MSNEAVLIHGWDPQFYNGNVTANPSETVAWERRPELLKLLSQDFDLGYYNLPGFSGVAEPVEDRYDVEDFAKSFGEWADKQEKSPKLIIGYSFGGAAALMHKALSNDPTPTVLISPAIYRGESTRSGIAHHAKRYIPQRWEDQFRHLYQFAMSTYYRKGTPFLRHTYNTIVRRDLRDLLSAVDASSLYVIYGERDHDTPWNLVSDKVQKSNIGYHVIASGGHNIGETHPEEIVKQISLFLQQK